MPRVKRANRHSGPVSVHRFLSCRKSIPQNRHKWRTCEDKTRQPHAWMVTSTGMRKGREVGRSVRTKWFDEQKFVFSAVEHQLVKDNGSKKDRGLGRLTWNCHELVAFPT